MKYRKQPVSTHCPEGIPVGDLTALIFDADPEASGLSGLLRQFKINTTPIQL